MLFAGEVFPVKHLRQITELWPAPAYYNLYGPTETNVCTYARIPLPIPFQRTEPYPIGVPCSHCAAVVLDDEGKTAAPGAEGLLYVAGPSVFAGSGGGPKKRRRDFARSAAYAGTTQATLCARNLATGSYTSGDGTAWSSGVATARAGGYRKWALPAPAGARSGGPGIAGSRFGREDRGLHRDRRRRSAVGHRVQRLLSTHVLPAYMIRDVFQFREALPRTSTNKLDYQTLLRESAAARETSA